MYVGDVCTERVITVDPDLTLRQAAVRMREFHVGDLIVVDDDDDGDRPIGIITDRDLVMTALAQDAGDLRIRDVMRDGLVTARDEDSALSVIEKMRSRHVRRIPIVNEDGVLVGVFTSDDAIALLADQLGSIAQLVLTQPRQEEQVRPG